MKKYLWLTSVFICCGCANSDKKAPTTDVGKKAIDTTVKKSQFKLYKLNDDFVVVDTGQYTNDGPMSGGPYAIIKKGDLTDTIDLYFGMKNLGNHNYLYYTLRVVPDDEGHASKSQRLSLDIDKCFLYSKSQKKLLKTVLSDFDDYFSSPQVIGQQIYYWQIKKTSSSVGYKISAAQYDPITEKTMSYYLKDDGVETDDSGYFLPPFLKKDTIYFDRNDKNLKKFSKDFKPYN